MRFAQGLFTVALIALLGVSYHHSRRSCFPQITRIETFFSPFPLLLPFCSRKLRHHAASHLNGPSSAPRMSSTASNVSTVRALLA